MDLYFSRNLANSSCVVFALNVSGLAWTSIPLCLRGMLQYV